ncbi:MAG: hypothetical protein IKO61_01795 [Lachnospiraceae bacterium]|nr:hypothetical protein [Lachnospiraceae bacterium]
MTVDNMMTMDDRQIRDNLEVEKRLISETDTLLRSMMELDESYFKETGAKDEDNSQVKEAEFNAVIEALRNEV